MSLPWKLELGFFSSISTFSFVNYWLMHPFSSNYGGKFKPVYADIVELMAFTFCFKRDTWIHMVCISGIFYQSLD